MAPPALRALALTSLGKRFNGRPMVLTACLRAAVMPVDRVYRLLPMVGRRRRLSEAVFVGVPLSCLDFPVLLG